MTYKISKGNWSFFQNFDSLEDAITFASNLYGSPYEVTVATEEEQIKEYILLQ